MRKSLLSSLMCVAVIATSALGDTLHLKNGSVLKGKVTSFADDQFIVMLDTGSGRYLSKAMVYMGDVARIEFDTTQGAAADSGSTTAQPADPSARLSSDPQGRDVYWFAPRPLEPAERGTDRWAIEHDLDFLALSFVRTAQDVIGLRQGVNAIASKRTAKGRTSIGDWLHLQDSDQLLYAQTPEISQQGANLEIHFNIPENSARLLLERLATSDITKVMASE